MSVIITQGLSSSLLIVQGFGEGGGTPPVIVTDACACVTVDLIFEAVVDIDFLYEAAVEMEKCECTI